MSPFKMVKVFQRCARVAKFRQIWSHWLTRRTTKYSKFVFATFEFDEYLPKRINSRHYIKGVTKYLIKLKSISKCYKIMKKIEIWSRC